MTSPFVRGSADLVAVIGATGRQGSAVVRHLLRNKWRVRALTRDPSSADAAAESGVSHVVYGAAGVGEQLTGVGSWDSKLAVAQHFRDLGLRLTVLRPMAFMELMTDKSYYPAPGSGT
jgi:uncharacterized protein YbjT (DUF2867 family)